MANFNVSAFLNKSVGDIVTVNGTKRQLNNKGVWETIGQDTSNLVVKVQGKDLSSNDFTDEFVQKIANLEKLVASDDATLDSIQEVVNFIKINKSALSALQIESIAGLSTSLSGKANVDLSNVTTLPDAVKNQLKGADGKSFSFADLTQDQLNSLKGEKGDNGEQGLRGKPFTYTDFTASQLAGLKGEKGDQGDKGDKGDTLAYGDLTAEQKNALRGKDGAAFTYADFTQTQLESLKGDKGDKGGKGDKGDQGDAGSSFEIETIFNSLSELLNGAVNDGKFGLVAGTLDEGDADYGKLYLYSQGNWTFITDMSVKGATGVRGPAGPSGPSGPDGKDGKDGVDGKDGAKLTFADLTEDDKALLKGDTGAAFAYADFTASQLAGLKGEKGDTGAAFKYADFTQTQLESLKGEKGDTGAAFAYADFTQAQLESLKVQPDYAKVSEVSTGTTTPANAKGGDIWAPKGETPAVAVEDTDGNLIWISL